LKYDWGRTYSSAPSLSLVLDPKGFLTNHPYDLQGKIDHYNASLSKKPLGSIFVIGGIQ
jgi:hypothetical protein